MLVREVMTQTVVSAPLSASVRRLAELMREHDVGVVVLTAPDGTPAGMVTDRDIALAVAAGVPPDLPAGEHASAPVLTTGPDRPLEEAAERMTRFGVRRLPVVEEGRLVGILALDDLAVRPGDPELRARLVAQVTRSSVPRYFDDHRGR